MVSDPTSLAHVFGPRPVQPPGCWYYSIVVSETNIYLGGHFSVLDDPLRSGLVRVSAVDGSTDRNWGPQSFNGTIYAIALNGDDVFIAGEFTVLGSFDRNNIAKLSATGSGAVDANWHPNANARVEKLLLSGNDIFAAGQFTRIDGRTRAYLAKLSASGTGAVDPLWDAKVQPASGAVISGMVVSGSSFYVSGSFTNIGGISRPGLAKLSTLGSGVVDTNWIPPEDFVALYPGQGSLALTHDALLVVTTASDYFGVSILKLDPNGTGERDPGWNPAFDYDPDLVRMSSWGVFAAGTFDLCNGAVSLLWPNSTS